MYYPSGDLTRAEHNHVKRALAIAAQSTCHQLHGSVIVMGKRVLAVGVNRNRNDPRVCTDPKSGAALHAEIAALKQVRGMDLRKATLISARVLKNETPALARPCPRCAAVIDYLEIGKVIYT